MINGVGKPGQGAVQSAAVATERSQRSSAVPAAASHRVAAGGSSLARDLARMGPPVDGDKVAAIRAAIAEGRYPVNPARIAEAMLSLDLPPVK